MGVLTCTCGKFVKICPFLFILHARFAFLEYFLLSNFASSLKLIVFHASMGKAGFYEEPPSISVFS